MYYRIIDKLKGIVAVQKAIIHILTYLLLCFGFSLSEAGKLNEAKIPVADRSAATLKQALSAGFTQVLVKLSGNPAVVTVPQIKNNLPAFNEFVTSYNYVKSTAAEEGDPIVLHVVFDEAAIKTLLQQSGQAVWDGERFPTLVLMSVQGDLGQTVVSSLQESPVITFVQRGAQDRGLKVLFPVMDLQDQASLNSQQMVSDFNSFMQRYHVQNVLFGKVIATEGGWYRIEWSLRLGDTTSQWATENADIGLAVDLGMDKLLETLASQYASMRSTKLLTNVSLEVDGINGLRDYVKVVSAVRHLHDVETVDVKDMNVDSLVLEVKVSGGQEALVRALSQSAVFKPLGVNSLNKQTAVDLVYQWVKPESENIFKPDNSQAYVHPLYSSEEVQDKVTTQPYRASEKVSRVSG